MKKFILTVVLVAMLAATGCGETIDTGSSGSGLAGEQQSSSQNTTKPTKKPTQKPTPKSEEPTETPTPAVDLSTPTLEKLKFVENYDILENRDYTWTAEPASNDVSGVVVFPEEYNGRKVTAIKGFDGTAITHVAIPGSIQEWTFHECSLLCEVVLSDGIRKIPDMALGACRSLQKFIIPKSVESIGDYAFAGDSGLQEIDIPEGVTTIGRGAFAYCGIKSITLPDSLTVIGEEDDNRFLYYDGLFYMCTSLSEVNLGKGITRIPNGMFKECSSLKNITIPSNVTEIGMAAFAESGLESVIIPDSVSVIGYRDMYFPDFHPNDGRATGVFAGCTALKEVTLSSQIKYIPEGTFYDCKMLFELKIPESVEEIHEKSLKCDHMEKLYVPKALENKSFDYLGGRGFNEAIERAELPETCEIVFY